MLEIKDLNVNLGPAEILRNASMDIVGGQTVGLIGRNGAGKTTTLRALMGLLKIQSGTIFFDHMELTKIPAQKRAHLGIGYMPEDRRLVPHLSSEENIKTPIWSLHIPDWEDRLAWIYDIIPEMEVFRDRASASLSGGQQKLVALGRALMIGNKMLVLDEPSEGVAPALAKRISEILLDLKSDGVSILISESNLQHCGNILDRVFTIERGVISED